MKLHSVTKRYATHPSPFRCISIHHTFSRLVNVSLQYPFKNYFGKRLNSKFIFPPTLHIVKPDQIVNLFERLYLMEKMDTCFSSFRFSCEIAHLWKGWISWESWTRVFYCEARPNYSFLEKAGQFKKLDAHFRTVQLFELSSFFKKWIIWSGFAILCTVHWKAIAKPYQIIHFLKKLDNSKSSTKPDHSKRSLYHWHFPNHPNSQNISNRPASHSWTHIFTLSSFFKKWIIWSCFAIFLVFGE